MSENKYIIDKDSLTGIANAVRDKLGVGKATTDPQTGDIVYPEGKGYYIETVSGVKKPIPYSVADIKNNIKDYWSIPEGSLNISANGTYDVTNKTEAVVNVPNPSTGSLEITENGTYDVTDKASAIVNVSSGGGGAPKIALLPQFYVGGTGKSATSLKNYGGFSNIYLIIGTYNGYYLGYLDMFNHPDKVGTYNGYDTYRFYRYYGGGEHPTMDVQHNTSNGGDKL